MNKFLSVEDYLHDIRSSYSYNHEGKIKTYQQENGLRGIFIPCTFDVCPFYDKGNALNASIIQRTTEIVIYLCDGDDMEFEHKCNSMAYAKAFYLRLPSIIDMDYLDAYFNHFRN